MVREIDRDELFVVGVLRYLAAACGWTGQAAEARAAIEGLHGLRPGFTVQDWAKFNWSDNPIFLRENQGIIEGLRKAGLPEGE